MIGDTDNGENTYLKVQLPIKEFRKFHEICALEYETPARMIIKLVKEHVVVLPKVGEFKFIPIYGRNVQSVRRTIPNIYIVSLISDPAISPDWETWTAYKEGIIIMEEFKRKYVEKLMGPVAQKRIEELKHMNKIRNIYIMDFSRDGKNTLKEIFIDFVEGKLLWK